MMAAGVAFAADNPFLGSWELTIPGGAAGWLGVRQSDGHLHSSMLWGWGSVEPINSTRLEHGQLVLRRNHEFEERSADGNKVRKTYVETIFAQTDGTHIHLISVQPRRNGRGFDTAQFSGRRTPPMPPAPDLSQVDYGAPIQLFDGEDLAGWRLTDPHAVSGWSVQDGILINNPVQVKGEPHKDYGNLRTDKVFKDFNLKVEVRVGKGENSGIYLRGIYEVQVEDSYGQGVDSHHMGAIYSRITPTVAAERPPGQWQDLDITFVHRHVTVILNGQKIIDNKPVEGCTGGALWSDVSRPGPIYLQGDHTGIEYRSIVLRPVID